MTPEEQQLLGWNTMQHRDTIEKLLTEIRDLLRELLHNLIVPASASDDRPTTR